MKRPSNSGRSNLVRFGIPAAMLAAGIASGVSVSGAFANEGAAPPPDANYRTNESGETYGSAADAPTPEQEPDLIEAYATNGRVGFVRREDLTDPLPTSLEEARQISARPPQSRAIPVYEVDGKTVIGQFVIEGGDK
jgi:hypothetical protein